MTSYRISSVICATLAVLAATSTRAADKSERDRLKPVPADQPIPASDFFRPPLIQWPTMSLDGAHIAAVGAVLEDHNSLMVYDLATKKPAFATIPRDRDVHDVWWAGDQHVIYTIMARKIYDAAVLVTEVGKLDRSTPIVQSAGARVVRVPEASPMQPLVWMSRGTETGHDEGVSVINAAKYTGPLIDLFSVNTSGTDYSDVKDYNIQHTLQVIPVPSGGLTTRYICDKDDHLEFAINEKEGVDTLYRLSGRNWEKCPVNLDDIEVVDAGNEPGELVVLGPRTGKPRALQFMDATTGKLGEVLLQDTAYDFNGYLYRDHASHKIDGLWYDRDAPTAVWFDENLKAIQKILDGQFKNQIVQILGWNRGMTRFLVGHYTDRQPTAFDWIDLEKKTTGPLGESRPWIDAARMRPVATFKFKTKDGHKLDAFLTLPADASPQHQVPLVVIPHGGPNMRDSGAFDPEAQYYASRGYAVLKANYRGSPGYNWMFPHEDEWDYVKMSEDVSSATRTAIRTKLVDPARVAILGTGFGGYLAIAGAANDPGLYRCAVTIDGIYDWAARATETSYNENEDPYHGWMMRRLGEPGQAKARYDAISPIRRADQIKAAVFVAYGQGTSPVEVGQAHGLISALEKNHVPVESMILADDVHGLAFLDKQAELRERIEAFLRQNMAK